MDASDWWKMPQWHHDDNNVDNYDNSDHDDDDDDHDGDEDDNDVDDDDDKVLWCIFDRWW